MNCGVLSIITQQLGDILTSQLVNAYSASIVMSGEVPFIRWITISTFSEVLSSIFLILILPLSLALIIDSIRENNWEISEKIEPIESQLEELLEELNNTLRPKIESPIRKKPLLSIAIAAGIGLLIGTLLTNNRK